VGLAELIVDAYMVKKFQIAGLPPWGDSGTDVFDLEAKLPGGDVHGRSRAAPGFWLVSGCDGVCLFRALLSFRVLASLGPEGPIVDACLCWAIPLLCAEMALKWQCTME
jgi:hypothetical protein